MKKLCTYFLSILLLTAAAGMAHASSVSAALKTYQNGQKNEAKAALATMHEAKNVEATFTLAYLYAREDNMEQALYLFRQAAQNGFARQVYNLAVTHQVAFEQAQQSGTPTEDKAIVSGIMSHRHNLLKIAAHADYLPAVRDYGMVQMLKARRNGSQQVMRSAWDYLEQAALTGDKTAIEAMPIVTGTLNDSNGFYVWSYITEALEITPEAERERNLEMLVELEEKMDRDQISRLHGSIERMMGQINAAK